MQANIPYNPFLVTGYAGPEYFCDREIETEKIISALNNDRSINLMSPRRYGKTGLIHHVFHHTCTGLVGRRLCSSHTYFG